MKANRMLRRALTMFILVALLATAFAPAALASSFKAKINTSSARVYSQPSTSSKLSVRAVKGVTVTVTAYSGSWAQIKYKDYTGYIPIKYLNLTNRIKAYTAAKSTPIYEKASSSSRSATLSIGTAVYVIGVSGDYCRVQNKSGSVTGYIKADNLTSKEKLTAAYNAWKKAQQAQQPQKPGSGTTPSKSNIDKVIALAKSLLGRPYALDDNPPSSFNCSSFVEYCMERYGYSMQGTAAAQAADGSYAKVTSGLKAGDVLCFDTDGDGTCDHTAIYLGNNSFIEASQNAGKVQTNTLTDWYKSHFLWARRPA